MTPALHLWSMARGHYISLSLAYDALRECSVGTVLDAARHRPSRTALSVSLTLWARCVLL